MYELPESLEGLDLEAIDAQIDSALDAFQGLNISEASSDEDLDTAEAIQAALNTLRAARSEVEAAAAARAERIARLTAEPEVETPATADETPAPEAVAADAEVITPDEVLDTQEVVPVAASAGQNPTRPASPVARAAAAAPEVIIPANKPVASLIAAADVPGYGNGQELEGMQAATKAILARTKGLPRQNLATAQGGVRQRYGAALIRKDGFGDLVQSDTASDYDLVWRAGDASRLPGGSLVAAGGWCAPSETLYDLCQYETVEGILDVPEFNVTRGGIRYTQGPDFADIYSACGFEQTEAEAIAGDCKDCCTVGCPAFSEIRMDAIGLCVKSPILTEHAYPELVQRFIEGALVAHQHKVNKYMLDHMLMAAGTPLVAPSLGSLRFNLEALAINALGLRYDYRLSQTASIEVILPFWVKTIWVMDLAMRNQSCCEAAEAEIAKWFSDRNLAPQWVYDFQDPTVNATTHAVTIPATFTALLYPSGTWSKGTADVISLDAVYDSPNLEANQYTALFVEEGILAVQKCLHTVAVTVTTCASGKGVLDSIDVCFPGDVAPT
jgi:hypothetical protein